MRYIDADALIEVLQEWRDTSSLNDGAGNPVDSILYDVIRRIEDAPPSDVAPREEIDKLQEVNADLNESLRLACEGNKDLQAELKAMRGAANSYKMHYKSLAKEIFAKIREKGSFSDPCVLHIVLSFEELAEIEQEFTEEK
jgi:hypothetical protein